MSASAAEASARVPLAVPEEAVPARELRTKCPRVWVLAAVGILLLVAVAVGVCYYLFAGQADHDLNCNIDYCQELHLPDNARSCGEARCMRCSEERGPGVDKGGGFCGLLCSLAHCEDKAVAARGATDCHNTTARLSCDRCEDGWELELDRSTLQPTGNCSFSCTPQQLQAGCAPRSCGAAQSCDACVPGFSHSQALRGGGSCAKVGGPVSMSFYMYRAQSDQSYPPENCDLASASGVMWYLHNEVVKMCPRHYDISRVLRYNVTVFNPPSVFPTRQGQFGHFVQFDYGQCTVPNCPSWWAKYGYSVGCQMQDSTKWKYEDSFWYSLPGRCPSQKWSNKTDECVQQELGGNCSQPDGTQTCTWHAELSGEVSVDELSGIKDIKAFCAAGNVEYDESTDRGRGCSFWDDKFNASRNKERVLAMQRLFAKRAPGDVFAVPAPLCDGF